MNSEQRVEEADLLVPAVFRERIIAVEWLEVPTCIRYTASFPFSWSVNLWLSDEVGLLTEE
jgi:hypothetical protein